MHNLPEAATKDWLVGLKFNGPVNTIYVMSSPSVYLTTFFLYRFSPLSGLQVLVHILSPETDNQRKGENNRSPRKNVTGPAGIEHAPSGSPVRRDKRLQTKTAYLQKPIYTNKEELISRKNNNYTYKKMTSWDDYLMILMRYLFSEFLYKSICY